MRGTSRAYRSPEEHPGERRLERDLRVAQAAQAVNASGNPMSHSTHVGLSAPPSRERPPALVWPRPFAAPRSGVERFIARYISVRFAPLLRSPLHGLGVGYSRATSLSGRLFFPCWLLAPHFQSRLAGVGHFTASSLRFRPPCFVP
jgi:hypothetical protein